MKKSMGRCSCPNCGSMGDTPPSTGTQISSAAIQGAVSSAIPAIQQGAQSIVSQAETQGNLQIPLLFYVALGVGIFWR